MVIFLQTEVGEMRTMGYLRTSGRRMAQNVPYIWCQSWHQSVSPGFTEVTEDSSLFLGLAGCALTVQNLFWMPKSCNSCTLGHLRISKLRLPARLLHLH